MRKIFGIFESCLFALLYFFFLLFFLLLYFFVLICTFVQETIHFLWRQWIFPHLILSTKTYWLKYLTFRIMHLIISVLFQEPIQFKQHYHIFPHLILTSKTIRRKIFFIYKKCIYLFPSYFKKPHILSDIIAYFLISFQTVKHFEENILHFWKRPFAYFNIISRTNIFWAIPSNNKPTTVNDQP